MDGIVCPYCNVSRNRFLCGSKRRTIIFCFKWIFGICFPGKEPCNYSVLQKARLIRILPTYWTCLVIIYIKDAIITIQNSSIHEVFAGQCGPQYMRYFLFLQCFIPSDDWNYWNNHSALWTMSSFALFYLVAPLLYRVMRRFYQSIVILIVFLFGTPYFTLWIENVF